MVDFLGGAFRAVTKSFAEWRRREAARAELELLDDRTLADIGLRRSDIPFALDGAYASHGREIGVQPAFVAKTNFQDRAAA
jgi:uncharacterized protein YjiS (DUF1127 family)